MANRDDAKQRRARENRARRAALAARKSGEAPKRPSRVAPSTAEKLAKKPQTSGGRVPDEAAADLPDDTKKSGKTARTKRERPPKLGDRPVDIATLEGSWLSKVTKVPGGMQALMAAVLTVLVSGMLATMDAFVADADVDKKDAKATLNIFEAYGTNRALFTLAIPLLLVFVAAGFSLHKHRRRIWVAAAIVLGVLFGTTLPHYIFPVGFLVYAVMRSSRVEGPNESLFASRRRRAATATEDEPDAESP